MRRIYVSRIKRRGTQRLKNIALAAFVLLSFSAMAADLSGQASAIDGATIEIHGQRIRLWGIDASEAAQLCRGADSLHYRCGAVAADALNRFIAGRPVACAPKDIDRYRRTVASCSVAGNDLARWMVSAGHALDWRQYSKGAYATDQANAEKAAAGMWSGSFAKPWAYRVCMGSGDALSKCSDGD